jgi:hypothetical protein
MIAKESGAYQYLKKKYKSSLRLRTYGLLSSNGCVHLQILYGCILVLCDIVTSLFYGDRRGRSFVVDMQR